jgi:hypothetical protein
MKRTTVAITAIMALLAFTALTAIASAAEPTKILPEPTAAKPVTATGKGGEGKLETVSGSTVTCKKNVGSASFTTPNLGSGKTLFEECTSSLATTCTGTGDKTGTIEAPATLHYILALEMLTGSTSTLVAALAFLVKQFSFICKKTGLELLVVARGCVAAKVDGTEQLKASNSVLFEAFTKGENKILSILIEETTKEIPCLLESSLAEVGGAEKFELSAIIQTSAATAAVLEKWTQSGAEINVLLMN